MSQVHVERRGAVATLTIDHAPGNRIDFAMREDVLAAVERVAADDARVLLVRGAGPDFCRGGDVRDWPGVPVDVLRPKIEVFARALAALRALPIPSIAVVQGACMGGGFELALSCDFVVAGRSATFRFPEANSGILTLQAGVLLLAERIGRAKALELVLTTETLEAERLAAWNVVNRVVDDAALGAEADALAARLAAGSPQVAAITKSLLDRWQDDGRQAALEAWYDASMPLFARDDVQAALRSTAQALRTGTAPPKATFED